MNAETLVRNNVHYCVSSLVTTLADAAGTFRQSAYDDARHNSAVKACMDLCQQAAELCAPVDDWEEAARQAGWFEDSDGDWDHPDKDDAVYASAQDVCEANEIEPYQWEIYEHWLISDWLAEKLEAKGERIDRDFAGMTIWGRTTTGQAISMDSVICEIARELERVTTNA